MKKKLLVIVVFATMFAFIAGCVGLHNVNQPAKIEMVELTKLIFYGKASGIEVPAIFGDFSLTHKIGGGISLGNNLAGLEWYPRNASEPMMFVLYAQNKCPEAVALYTFNRKTEKETFWIYLSLNEIKQVSEEVYWEFLNAEHPCINPVLIPGLSV